MLRKLALLLSSPLLATPALAEAQIVVCFFDSPLPGAEPIPRVVERSFGFIADGATGAFRDMEKQDRSWRLSTRKIYATYFALFSADYAISISLKTDSKEDGPNSDNMRLAPAHLAFHGAKMLEGTCGYQGTADWAFLFEKP